MQAGTVVTQKTRDNVDLILRDQGWRVAAILHRIRRRIAVPAQHVGKHRLAKQIGLLPADDQNGYIDSVPIFPEVDAVVPGIAERMGDPWIAQRLEALPLRLPFHTMDGQMTPMLILQFPERSQYPPVVEFRRLDRIETLRGFTEVGAQTK